MSHTPGPWEFNPIDRVVVKDNVVDIAHMGRSANGADMCLVAAAPELLEALMEVFEDKGLVDSLSWIDKAACAIAKTRGQQ